VMMTLSLACLSHSCASSGANAKQLETEAVNGYSTLVCGTRSSIRKAPRRPRRQQHIVQYGKTEPAGQVSGAQKKLLSWMDGARTAQHSTGHLSPRTPRDQSYCTVPTERVLGQSAATPVWVCVWNGRARTNLPKSAQHSPLLFQQQSLLVVLYCSMPFSR
jgi:hypothetical protein